MPRSSRSTLTLPTVRAITVRVTQEDIEQATQLQLHMADVPPFGADYEAPQRRTPLACAIRRLYGLGSWIGQELVLIGQWSFWHSTRSKEQTAMWLGGQPAQPMVLRLTRPHALRDKALKDIAFQDIHEARSAA